MTRTPLRAVLLTVILTLVSPGSGVAQVGGIPGFSDLAVAARELAALLARGARYDTVSLARLLDTLNSTTVSGAATDATVRESLKALSGGARTAIEHVSQLELLMDRLERALKQAQTGLEQSNGPSLEQLADPGSRCRTINRLRSVNRSFDAADTTVRDLPSTLDRAAVRADLLQRFLADWARALEVMFDHPALTALLYETLGRIWVDTLYDADTAATLQRRIERVRKQVLAFQGELETRRTRYRSNMTALVEPLARESCDRGDESREAVVEPASQPPIDTPAPATKGTGYQPRHRPIRGLCQQLGTC